MNAGRGRGVRHFAESREHLIGRARQNRGHRDQCRHATEAIRTHARAGEGGGDGDLIECRRTPHDILKDRRPGDDTQIELDMGVAGFYFGQPIGDDGIEHAVGVGRGAMRVAQHRDIEFEALRRTVLGEEIKAVAVGFGAEDMREDEPLERRHIGVGNRRLHDGRNVIAGHIRLLKMTKPGRAGRDVRKKGCALADQSGSRAPARMASALAMAGKARSRQ